MDDGQERSFNSQAGGPHDSTAADGHFGDSSAAGTSTESDGIGDFDSSGEEAGSERDHEDSTNSECSASKPKSVLKRRPSNGTVDEPANAHLGEKHSVRLAEDAKWYFVKDNRAANAK